MKYGKRLRTKARTYRCATCWYTYLCMVGEEKRHMRFPCRKQPRCVPFSHRHSLETNVDQNKRALQHSVWFDG